MNTLTLVLGLLAIIMVGVAWQACRLGNEQRDIAFLAVTAGLLGAGAAVSAAL